MLKAGKDITSVYVTIEKGTEWTKGMEKSISREEFDMLHTLYVEGSTRAQYYENQLLELQNQKALDQLGWDNMGAWRKIAQASGFMFRHAESYNRMTAALAMYRTSLKKGNNNIQASVDAKKFIADTHYDMGKRNKPKVARGEYGATGDFLITFRSFTMNYIESMIHYMKIDQTQPFVTKNKDGSMNWNNNLGLDVAMRSMAYMMMFGGMAAVPFLDDILDKYEEMTGNPIRTDIGNLLGSEDDPLRVGFEMGLPAMMLGINMSGSLRIGLPNPFSLEAMEDTVFGVYGGLGDKGVNAVEAFKSRDFVRAAASLAPEAITGLEKAYRGATAGVSTRAGVTLTDQNRQPVKMQPGEAVVQGMAFSPARINAINKRHRTGANVEAYWQNKRSKIYKRYRRALRLKDRDKIQKLQQEIREYNKDVQGLNVRKVIPRITPQSLKQVSRTKKHKVSEELSRLRKQ